MYLSDCRQVSYATKSDKYSENCMVAQCLSIVFHANAVNLRCYSLLYKQLDKIYTIILR